MLRTDGFTLLEVLIAVSIFAIGILAVASMQLTSIRGTAFGDEMTAATFLAQDQLEWMKSQSIDSATLTVAPINDPDDAAYDAGADPVEIPDPNNPMNKDGTPGGIFNRTWHVLPGSGASRRIAVTVTWSAGLGSHSVTIRTITRGGGE